MTVQSFTFVHVSSQVDFDCVQACSDEDTLNCACYPVMDLTHWQDEFSQFVSSVWMNGWDSVVKVTWLYERGKLYKSDF